ncbi:hypothetical protein BDV26DRAFT_273168 [Aspergillus bertholletiae]|uniref:Uncharacterized protein n=1 Tax=Aspergillus bertholletiae TaxID=1226010 RepID=A0A5N7AUB1_9EURO|nr:hypothetical protein BDV26DRAFT_273168 [Aspergillus bertholletiae]
MSVTFGSSTSVRPPSNHTSPTWSYFKFRWLITRATVLQRLMMEPRASKKRHPIRHEDNSPSPPPPLKAQRAILTTKTCNYKLTSQYSPCIHTYNN